MLLLRAVRARLGEESFRSGLALMAFEQDKTGVNTTFVGSEKGTLVRDRADILVGADGIHSRVRRQLYPREGEPRFAGQIMWRAAVDTQPFLDGRTMIIAGHYSQRIIAYPIGPGATPGTLLSNWICQTAVPDSACSREDWHRRVDKERVLAAFGKWHFPWLNVPDIVSQTSEIFEFPLVDRDPVEAWSFGRVTLIGDAAHPMQPIGSQAGSQAIIDARALTGALVAIPDPVAALHRYDTERRSVMNDITLRNRRFGPEAALQIVEDRAPDGFARIDDVMSQAELKAITTSFDSAAGLARDTVNSRASFV
jgi:2-polyprenyl-6-methoxyphenol hydroxylase-like FAD-dependent oxidoreductase